MLTQNAKRSVGLKLAFSELGNKHYSPEQKEALGKAADKASEALRAITQQVVGYVVSHFAHVALPTRMAEDDIVDFSAEDFPGAFDDFLSALGESAGAALLSTGSGTPENVQIDTGTSQDWIKNWGSDLVTGILHNYKDELNTIITNGMKDGLGREDITKLLLAQASPEAGALMPEWRARLIAQTEVIRGFNGERLNQMKAIGVSFSMWLDGQAGACEDCAMLDGTVIPLEESGNSYVSGDRGLTVEMPPLHPGCRCAITSADQEDFTNQANFDSLEYVDGGSLQEEDGLPPGVTAPGSEDKSSLASVELYQEAKLEYDQPVEEHEAATEKFLNQHFGHEKYTQEELSALRFYGGNGASGINASLRAGSVSSEAAAVESAIAKGSLKENTVLWRGVGRMDIPEVGSEFVEPSFTSTSMFRFPAQRYSDGGYLIRIEAPKGTPAASLERAHGQLTEEHEVLLQRNARFHVNSVTQEEFPYSNGPIKVVNVSLVGYD